jgi:hypothetical protein
MPKGHKPSESSRNFKIRGVAGNTRKTGAARTQQKTMNEMMRSRRCVCCGAARPRFGSYPVCAPCITKHHKED